MRARPSLAVHCICTLLAALCMQRAPVSAATAQHRRLCRSLPRPQPNLQHVLISARSVASGSRTRTWRADADTRRSTAARLFALLRSLSRRIPTKDPLLQAITVLPPPKVVPSSWTSLLDLIQLNGTDAISDALTVTPEKVPVLNRSRGHDCQLTRTEYCWRFQDNDLNRFVHRVFTTIVVGSLLKGLPKVQLDQFDLFHGHLFLDHEHKRPGILFHAKEYPAYDPLKFPIQLGYCQDPSTLQFVQHGMDLRNIIYYEGQLAVLDVGVTSPLHESLLVDYARPLRTVYEEDLGSPLVDVNYLGPLLYLPPERRVFIC